MRQRLLPLATFASVIFLFYCGINNAQIQPKRALLDLGLTNSHPFLLPARAKINDGRVGFTKESNATNSVGDITLYGFVKDTQGAGVSGIQVTLTGPTSGITTTISSGYYGFAVPSEAGCAAGQSQSYSVLAYGYNFVTDKYDLPLSSSTNGCLFSDIRFGDLITGRPHQITLDGYVRDSSGNGVAGIAITLSGVESGSTLTGSDGHYSFTVKARCGEYFVVATVDGQTIGSVTLSGCALSDDTFADFHYTPPTPTPTPTPEPTPTPFPTPTPGGGGGTPTPTPTPTPSEPLIFVPGISASLLNEVGWINQ